MEFLTMAINFQVMRHGDRAPQDTYPNDPYINNSMEPYGWGQLTNVMLYTIPITISTFLLST